MRRLRKMRDTFRAMAIAMFMASHEPMPCLGVYGIDIGGGFSNASVVGGSAISFGMDFC